MAEIFENEKGLKIIKTTRLEWADISPVSNPVCDSCNEEIADDCYYVAVLNMLFCPECFNKWIKNEPAVADPNDKEFEERCFNHYWTVLTKRTNMPFENFLDGLFDEFDAYDNYIEEALYDSFEKCCDRNFLTAPNTHFPFSFGHTLADLENYWKHAKDFADEFDNERKYFDFYISMAKKQYDIIIAAGMEDPETDVLAWVDEHPESYVFGNNFGL